MGANYVRVAPQSLATMGSTGAGTAPSCPNWGVTVITYTSAETITLQPPEVGIRKTLICMSSTSVARTVQCSTAQTVTLGNQTQSKLLFSAASTVDVCVTLIGVSSVRWVIENIHPTVAAASAAVTLSS